VLQSGSTFGDYVIEGVAGSGGMGVVYRARQERLNRLVALKLVNPERALDPMVRERLRREALAVASLDHPNIIPLYEAGDEAGTIFIATRWVEGIELGELIRSGGALDPERAADIVKQVAAALDEAHGSGLVHRDIKPSNVLMTAQDHVYLTDFGLTRHEASVSGLTVVGQLVGTVDYAAPEQIEGEPVDFRADIYGLGCLAVEILTERVPFDREGLAAKMWAHLNAEPPSLSERRPELAPGVDPVIARALAKDPRKRFDSATEFAAALLVAVGSNQPSASPAEAGGWPGEPGSNGHREAAVPASATEKPRLWTAAAARAAPEEPAPPVRPLAEDAEPVVPADERKTHVHPETVPESRVEESGAEPPSADSESLARQRPSEPPRPAARRAAGRRRARGRILAAVVALGIVLAGVAAVLGLGQGDGLSLLGGGAPDPPASAPVPPRPEARDGKAAPNDSGRGTSRPAPRTTTSIPPQARRPDLAASARLREQGYELIRTGSYPEAARVFRQAAGVSTTRDVSYASSIFGLGRALRLSGRSSEALDVLKRRAELPPRTANSQKELAAARAAVRSE